MAKDGNFSWGLKIRIDTYRHPRNFDDTPYIIGSTKTHYHPSLSELIKDHGTAKLALLESFEEVAPLDKAEVVPTENRRRKDNWTVVYSKMMEVCI